MNARWITIFLVYFICVDATKKNKKDYLDFNLHDIRNLQNKDHEDDAFWQKACTLYELVQGTPDPAKFFILLYPKFFSFYDWRNEKLRRFLTDKAEELYDLILRINQKKAFAVSDFDSIKEE